MDFDQEIGVALQGPPISGRKKTRKSVRNFPIRTGQEISRKSVRIAETARKWPEPTLCGGPLQTTPEEVTGGLWPRR